MITAQVVSQSRMAVQVRLRNAGKDAERGLSAGIQRAIRLLAGLVQTRYLTGQVLKVKTGNLRKNVQYRMRRRLEGLVGVGRAAWYGKAHEFGVGRSWVIRARGAHSVISTQKERAATRALRFVVNGKVIYRKSVTHPPMKERSFLRRALAEQTPLLIETINREVEKAITRP